MALSHDEKTLGLPILDSPTHLFEKIIKKLKHKSYARLQMTCKSMADFAQTTTIMPKYEHIDARVAWHTGRDSPWLADSHRAPLVPFDNEQPAKETRYKKISIAGEDFLDESDLDITVLLKFLEKNRISCVELYVMAYEDEFFLSSAHWLILLRILKPEKIIVQSHYQNLIKIFINYPNNLDEIGLEDRTDEIKEALGRLKSIGNILPMVTHYWMDDLEEFHSLCRKIIEFLNSDHAKNLTDFKYCFNLTMRYFFGKNLKRITSTEVASNLPDYAATEETNDDGEVIVKGRLHHGECSILIPTRKDIELHYKKID